jgi:hypothetical protein
MTRQLEKLIDMAKAEVAKSPILGLSFKTRQGILRAMGPIPKEGTLGPGLIRRARLCCAIVKPALPLWEAHYDSKDPHKMIKLAERYLGGKGGRDELMEESTSFRGGLDTSDSPKKDVAFLVGRGSVRAAFVAAYDEVLEPDEDAGFTREDLEDPQDPDYWDCAFWIAGAQAGGMPWVNKFKKKNHGEFWRWYLDVAVPAAWASVAG